MLVRVRNVVGVSVVIIIAAHFVNDAFATTLPVYLPLLQLRLGLGEVGLAGLVAVVSISANVLQVPMGAVADRWGRRRSAVVGICVSTSFMSCIAIAPNTWLLVVCLIFGGLGSALFHPSAVSLIREVTNQPALVTGVFTASGMIGTAAMPIVALAVIRNSGPEYIPLLAASGLLLAALLLLATTAVKVAPTHTKVRPEPYLSLLSGPVALLACAGVLRAAAYVSFMNAIPLYLVNVRGVAVDSPLIGTTLAVYGLAGAAGTVLVGALAAYFDRRILIVGTMLLAFPCLLLTLFVPSKSLPFLVATALGGLFTNASIPLLVVSAQNLRPSAVGTVSGMLMGLTWGTAGMAYIGFGALQRAIGIAPALGVAYFLLVPAALIASRVLARPASSTT